MKDKTGRDLRVGQVVDLHINEMMSAYVVEIHETPVADAAGRVRPPFIMLQVTIPLRADPRVGADVYIVREPEPERPKIVLDPSSTGSAVH